MMNMAGSRKNARDDLLTASQYIYETYQWRHNGHSQVTANRIHEVQKTVRLWDSGHVLPEHYTYDLALDMWGFHWTEELMLPD